MIQKEKQVDKSHYVFTKYVKLDRWSSYYYQLREVLSLAPLPETILEIGAGDGVFGLYIKNHTLIRYQSMDIADDLHPDLVGAIDAIPLKNELIDCVVAFEVLEHIPFERVSTALAELARVSKKNVIISIPHFGPRFEFHLKIPLLPRIQFAFKFPYTKTHVFNGEHYWELGKKDYSTAQFRDLLAQYFVIRKEFVPFENAYHHFFVLEKNKIIL